MPYGKYVKSYRRHSFSNSFAGGVSRQSNKRRGGARASYARSRRPRKAKSSLLSDKKINTLVEVRMQEIAKKEVQKNLKVLTSRKYLFVNYDLLTNEFNTISPARPDLVDWVGNVVELSNIAKTDSATTPNVPQVDDPDTMQDENADGDGPNQIMLAQDINGERWGDIIYIKSVSANLRIRSMQLTDEDLDLFQSIKVTYAFVLWRDEETTMDDVTAEPDANQLLKSPQPWAYQAKLDKALNMVFHGLKTTVLCKGETILNMNDISTSEKFHTIYKTFDKPIQISYDPRSQNGQRCNKKLYFVCRSTIPAHQDYQDVKPSVYACTKVNYYEA